MRASGSLSAACANGNRYNYAFGNVNSIMSHMPTATAASFAIRLRIIPHSTGAATTKDHDIQITFMGRDRHILRLRDNDGFCHLALMGQGRQGVVHGGVCGPGALVRPDKSRRLIAEEGGLAEGRALLLGAVRPGHVVGVFLPGHGYHLHPPRVQGYSILHSLAPFINIPRRRGRRRKTTPGTSG